jgi:hypothetical protein
METTTRLNEAVDNPRSRRALLAGAVGGLGAWLVSAAQRVMPAEAASGDPVRIGQISGSLSTTGLRARSGEPVFRAVQMGGGTGLRGESASGRAVFATTETGVGVNARASGLNSVALFGDARGRDALALLAFGPSHLDGDLTVVGRLFVTDPMTFSQTSAAPRTPNSGQARLFARDNGWGKTQLCVQFASGAVQTLATEP